MKKESIILIFALICISVSGCYGSSSSGSTSSGNYHTGYQGYTMRFIEGNPPDRVYASNKGGDSETDTFNIMLEVKNEGAYDVDQNKFVISGYDDSIVEGLGGYSKQNLDELGTLNGRNTDNPLGDFDTITWRGVSIKLPEGTDEFSQTFMVSACYDYETKATIAVCVDPKPWSTGVREEVCTPGSVSASGGQGAPVAVTNVEVTPMDNKVQMKVEIQNVGSGNVLSVGSSSHSLSQSYTNCPHDLSYKDLNEVYVDVNLQSSSGGNPKPNPVQLINGRGYFYVTFDLRDTQGRENAYMTILDITLTYGYTESITKTVNVITVPG